MENLLALLHSIKPLSPALESHLRSIIAFKRFEKGEIMLREGDIAKRIFFIEKGLVRSYYFEENMEASNWFMKEGDVCISICSFLEQEPSEDTLVALEDCETWGISYDQLELTYDRFPEFERHGRIVTGKYYVWSEKRHKAILRKTPSYKYANLMQSNPDLARRVPVKDLGTYLNISERTFSRIRKKYAAKHRKAK